MLTLKIKIQKFPKGLSVDQYSLCLVLGYSRPSQCPPYLVSPSRSHAHYHALKPATGKVSANGHGHTCLQKIHNKQFYLTTQICTHGFSGFCKYNLLILAVAMLPLKLQCLRMKKRQISSLSASLMVLVAPAELEGDVENAGVVGDVGDVGDLGDLELLWVGL